MPELKILGDSPTTEDGLGFKSYVNILLEAINNFDARSPLTIGIHGRWGSGKTSLMKMLKERVEDDNKVKTIWFNAWAHGREEPIGLALLQEVLLEFQKDEQTKEKFVEFARSFSKLLADAALRKTTGISFREAKELFENSIKVKSTLRGDFEDAINASPVERFVVFIDDLDRCLPEKTIEILEVIKLFLGVPRCVFVIGVAEEVIKQGIEVRYKKGEQGLSISGKDYIEKIIQVPFTLPPIRVPDMIKFIENLGISGKEEEYAKIVAKGTGYNPRRVKLFLNTLRIRQEVAAKSGGELEPAVAAKLFVIEYSFQDFYENVKKYREQDFLCTVERLVKGEDDEDLRKKLESSKTLQKYYENEDYEDLRSVLKDEPSFCERDIEPYIYLSGTKPPEELLEFDASMNELLSGDFIKTNHVAKEIKKMPDSDRQQYLDRTISKLKEDPNSQVRLNAVVALGAIGDAKAVEPLIVAFRDKSQNVRYTAEEALVRIGDEAVEPLITALEHKQVVVRDSAARTLGSIGNPEACDALKAALKKETNTNVRTVIKNALENIEAKQKSK